MSSRYHGHIEMDKHHSMRYYINYPFQHEREMHWELERQYGPQRDPDKPPPRERGDKFIIIYSTIGVILGGIIGGVIGVVFSLHFFAVVLSVIGGVVIGGILGVIIGTRIKRRYLSK